MKDVSYIKLTYYISSAEYASSLSNLYKYVTGTSEQN